MGKRVVSRSVLTKGGEEILVTNFMELVGGKTIFTTTYVPTERSALISCPWMQRMIRTGVRVEIDSVLENIEGSEDQVHALITTRIASESELATELEKTFRSRIHEVLKDFPDLLVSPIGGPELLLGFRLVDVVGKEGDNQLVGAVTDAWLCLLSELKNDPSLLQAFADSPRKFEEFIAGAYVRSGWPKVELTPFSGDKGIDVVLTASDPRIGTVRVVEQLKAYSDKNKVTANDVRAMLGVLEREKGASKAIVTTTGQFAPGIFDELSDFMPGRLELRDRASLVQWLRSL
jgi:hypothetical protein